MPNLGGTPKKQPVKKKAPASPEGTKVPHKLPPKDAALLRKSRSTEEEIDEEDEGDEVVGASSSGGHFSSKAIVAVLVGVIALILFAFALILLKTPDRSPTPSDTDVPSGTQQSSDYVEPNNNAGGDQSDPVDPTNQLMNDWGAKDFTQNTTMESNSKVEPGSDFLKDISGLSLNAKYTVSDISEVPTFVSYTKHRGTSSAGMELYWLDATYRDRSYVIQVPFKYYKELDEMGIVPVKAEVLSITGETAELNRTIISYMSLDEETLKTVLDAQSGGSY